ncbi:MAG: response regulator transcription factor [Ottowia sp.]|uniref:response regulator transcription factor n=1 Tax=Ottowia sp. TaxID=1898956 RepID=UPI0039E6C4B2
MGASEEQQGPAARPQPASARRLPRVLVVDDDLRLARMLGEYLADETWLLEFAHDGGLARDLLLRRRFDLLVLDVMLPTLDGFALLRCARQRHAGLPVLMLSARAEARDRILGLESGADDYLAKPFDPRELRARMRALLRRGVRAAPDAGQGAGDVVLTLGALELAPATGLARLGARTARLTRAESRMLAMLMRAEGRPVGRAQLTQWVLGRALLVTDRSLDTHGSNLRRKLGLVGAQAAEPMLRSIRGVGYVLALPPAPR